MVAEKKVFERDTDALLVLAWVPRWGRAEAWSGWGCRKLPMW